MSYNHPRQTNPYPQGNVQGGQAQDSSYTNRTSRSHSLQPSVHTGGNPTLNRSLSHNRTPVSGQAQSFDPYGTGQSREPGLPYVPPTNTPPYIGGQGQIQSPIQSPSYQDPSQAYRPGEYFPIESPTPHIVPQQSRTHQLSPQQPSVLHNPSHPVQDQHSQYQHGDVEYPVGQPPVQQRRSSSSQYQQRQQQPQQPLSPSTQLYPQQPQSSAPQYQQHQQHQQPSTQHYPQPRRSSPPQPQRQYQPPSQPYTQGQPSPSLRQQGNYATGHGNPTPSFGANVPSELYETPRLREETRQTPREETRQSRSTQRGTSPVCRLANCRNPAIRDGATQELTEYCSQDHMQEDADRGARLCPACNKCPHRINGKYCGTSCEKYDRERLQQPRQQQQHYPRPPAGVRPHLSTPSPSANVIWSRGGSSSVSNSTPDNHQVPAVGGLVLCPKCNTTYSARGRSHPRSAGYGGQGSPVDSLPPCPMCGFSQRT